VAISPEHVAYESVPLYLRIAPDFHFKFRNLAPRLRDGGCPRSWGLNSPRIAPPAPRHSLSRQRNRGFGRRMGVHPIPPCFFRHIASRRLRDKNWSCASESLQVSFLSTTANPPLCHSFNPLQLWIVLTAARALLRNAFGVLVVASNHDEYPTVKKETSGRCGRSR